MTGCTDLFGPAKMRQGIPVGLQMHLLFAQAAYQIRHPKAVPLSTEVLVAGVEGTLRTYEALRGLKGVTEPLFEDLIDKRENGALAGYVAERARYCPVLEPGPSANLDPTDDSVRDQ